MLWAIWMSFRSIGRSVRGIYRSWEGYDRRFAYCSPILHSGEACSRRGDMSLRIIVDSPWSDEVPAGLCLRAELSVRSLKWALEHGFLHERTDGAIPSILFGREEGGRHGNFHPASYQRICSIPAWSKRLEKVHTAYRRARVRANWSWKELDCSNSSDALLMNVFCYPGLTDVPRVRALLGNDPSASPEFGYKPRTPLSNGRRDNTEIDMRLGGLLLEAKLTACDFQVGDRRLVERYCNFDIIFDITQLPFRNGKHLGYQLIRGALAAYASGGNFCVLCDACRVDLQERWYSILRAVRLSDLRCRLKLLTWQELATAVPFDLQEFLETKYGIVP